MIERLFCLVAACEAFRPKEVVSLLDDPNPHAAAPLAAAAACIADASGAADAAGLLRVPGRADFDPEELGIDAAAGGAVLDEIGRFRLRQAQRDKEVEEAKKQKVCPFVDSYRISHCCACLSPSHTPHVVLFDRSRRTTHTCLLQVRQRIREFEERQRREAAAAAAAPPDATTTTGTGMGTGAGTGIADVAVAGQHDPRDLRYASAPTAPPTSSTFGAGAGAGTKRGRDESLSAATSEEDEEAKRRRRQQVRTTLPHDVRYLTLCLDTRNCLTFLRYSPLPSLPPSNRLGLGPGAAVRGRRGRGGGLRRRQ